MTTRTPVNLCPSCGHTIDALGRPDGGDILPRPDDVTLCINCAAVLIINHDLTVRSPTPGELDDMKTDMDLRKLQETIQYINAREAARRSNPRLRSRRPRRSKLIYG